LAGPLDFRLAPGLDVLVRVVDSHGQALEGARVELTIWCNRPINEHPNYVLNHEVVTDELGLAVLKDCPVEPLRCNISRPGYVSLKDVSVVGANESVEFRLKRQGRYTGRVLDAHTELPIRRFTVLEGISYNNGGIIRWEEQATSYHNRPYEFAFEAEQMVLRISADGYAPLDLPIWTNDEASHVHDVYLTPDEQAHIDWQLTVVDPHGQPVPDAAVAYVGNLDLLFFSSLSFHCPMTLKGHVPVCTPDANGVVVLTKNPHMLYVMVTHASGYASVSLAGLETDRATIPLTPWGRIEGRVTQGVPSDAPIVIQAWGGRTPIGTIRYEEETQVQDDGTFVLERVVPGALSISHMARARSGKAQKVRQQTVDVVAGQTSHVQLDLDWVTVKAQVTVDADNVDYSRVTAVLETYVDPNASTVRFNLPASYLCLGSDDRTQLMNAWKKNNPQWQAYRKELGETRGLTQQYEPSLNARGMLEFEMIRPGVYTLQAELSKYGHTDLYRFKTGPIYAAEQHAVRWPLAMTHVDRGIKGQHVNQYPDSFTLISREGIVLVTVKAENADTLVDVVKQMISEYNGSLSP